MSNKNLVILAVVATVLVVWAAIQSRVSNDASVESDTLRYLLQGLDPADIAGIVIGKGEDAVSLKRQGRGFVVANRSDYPAKAEEVSNMLSQCLDVQVSEVYTDNANNFEDLGVTEEKASSIVKFMKDDPNSPLLAGLIVGKSQELGQGTYIRMLPDDKVYVSAKSPYIPSSISNYFEQELISAKKDDIESVTLKGPDGMYVLKKDKDSNKVIMENLPAGKKLKESDAETVFSAFTSLRCEDVHRSVEGLDLNQQYVCRLKDSTVYTVSIAQKDGKIYVTCRTEYTGEVPTKGEEKESDEVLKEKEAKLLAFDKVNKLSARHRGWIYQISEWKAKSLTKKLADLIEDEEKSKVEESNTVDVKAVDANSIAAAVEAITVGSAEVVEPNAVEDAEANTAETVEPNVVLP